MEGDQLEIPMASISVPPQEADHVRSLWDIVRDYVEGAITPPPHQRDPEVWNKKRRREWVDRVVDSVIGRSPRPLGAICTYSLSNGTEHYINDGLQRIHSLKKALDAPQDFALKKDIIERVLRTCRLPCQHRVYTTHGEAAMDFELVNRGLWLEAGERNKRHLVYKTNWQLWEPILKRWESDIGNTVGSYARSHTRRQARDTERRQALQLFCLAHNKEVKRVDNSSALEEAAAECCERLSSPETVERKMKELQANSSVVETAWRQYAPSHGVMMQHAFAAWCIGVMFVYKCPPNWWEAFFAALFKKTAGQAMINYEKRHEKTGHIVPRSLHLSKRLDNFTSVLDILQIKMPDLIRRRSPYILKPGYEEDHLFSLTDFGEGETRFLASPLNKAKNARKPLDN